MQALKYNVGVIAGVDEVGRGPLAGPVVAAAVILNNLYPISGLADSKTLSPTRRDKLADLIKRYSLCWALGRADVNEIDQLNILQASLLAMQRAVSGLSVRPEHVLVDGNQPPKLACPVTTIIQGDATIPSISAASILAKVSRDAEMCTLDLQYPGYGFAQHKGYPTATHLEALRKHGVSPIHRRSFAPVRRLLEMENDPVDVF